MADTKISAMSSASTLTGNENVPLVQGGTNVQATTGNLVAQVLNVTPATVAQGGTNATTAAAARTNLGLGTIATQSAASVAITGGSITGITDLAVADGGTGASDAATARTNLGAAASATTIAASTGLSGGGDLSANRTLAIANTGVTAATYGSSTRIPVIAVNAQGQITSASNALVALPSYGQFYSVAPQTALGVDTVTRVAIEGTTVATGMSLATNQITLTNAGNYLVTVALQVSNSDGYGEFAAWLDLDGVDVPVSALAVTVQPKHSTQNGLSLLTQPFIVTATAGQKLGVRWAVNSTTITLFSNPTGQTTPFVAPAIPSVILNVQQVA